MRGKPTCPSVTTLNSQITECERFRTEATDPDNKLFWAGMVNSLYYLQTSLDNRRGYQKKQMEKRKVFAKYLKENPDLATLIDDAVKARHSNVMEAESLDDVEDTEEGEDA